MSYVYKQFTAQDKALVPFNAHKQYDINSSSVASNSITHYSTQWTSESIDLYSSATTHSDAHTYGGDSRNVIKYNQIDKLFYRNYITQIYDKVGPIYYEIQSRDLYEKANILSIPMGLYGNEIKPGSFYLSSSEYSIIDDKYGNLMISGSDTGSYPNNIHQNVFRLGPIKGFKKYDLGVYDGYAIVKASNITTTPNDYDKNYYRKGKRMDANVPTTYTSYTRVPVDFYPKDIDDSYYTNNIHYRNVSFSTSSLGTLTHKFSQIQFDSTTGSFISSSHKEHYNFNKDDNFAVSFWIKPKGIKITGGVGSSVVENGFTVEDYSNYVHDNNRRYIIAKSQTKTYHHIENWASSQDPEDAPAESQYPYEIYMQSSSLYFSISDGGITKTIKAEITSSTTSRINKLAHIFCQNSGSGDKMEMQIYFNGTKIVSSSTADHGTFINQTRNTANFYIGSVGEINTTIDKSGGIESSSIQNGFVIENYVNKKTNNYRHYNGDINDINIWARSYNTEQIGNISESVNASPYIGNIFYSTGFATITHPNYHNILNTSGIGTSSIGENSQNMFQIGNRGIHQLQFQGTHLLYEHEYQCTVHKHEFNNTTNLSARKFKSPTNYELANFTTSSHFQPHVTTIGLYNKNW